MTPIGHLLHYNAESEIDKARRGRLFHKICYCLKWRGNLSSSTHGHSWAQWLGLFLLSVTAHEEACVFTSDFSVVLDLPHFCSVGIHRPSARILWCSQTLTLDPLYSCPQAPFHCFSQSLSRHRNICSTCPERRQADAAVKACLDAD